MRKVIQTSLDKILIHQNTAGAINYVKSQIVDLLQNKTDISRLVITKSLNKGAEYALGLGGKKEDYKSETEGKWRTEIEMATAASRMAVKADTVTEIFRCAERSCRYRHLKQQKAHFFELVQSCFKNYSNNSKNETFRNPLVVENF